MGLLEQITSGARFNRVSVQLPTGPVTGKTDAFGSTYVLLNVSVTEPCRVRLYFDSASRYIDQPRPTSSFSVSASVGLILDTYVPAGTSSLSFDPPILGTTLSGSETWYTVDECVTPIVRFDAYPIESSLVSDRSTREIRRTNFTTGSGAIAEGTLSTPKSFLIISASATSESRLRLYSRPNTEITTAERIRPFGVTPATGSFLIADMMFDSSSYGYKISPLIQAYNLEDYLDGVARVGYLLQNSSSASPIQYTASLYIYSLED